MIEKLDIELASMGVEDNFYDYSKLEIINKLNEIIDVLNKQ